ncbi:hypothetical protein PLCT2_01994 [Planctomycetaceae bacterium]|nr:hypothetical protein PLCT2_01994 [Planctomycetaceae bacterium]
MTIVIRTRGGNVPANNPNSNGSTRRGSIGR